MMDNDKRKAAEAFIEFHAEQNEDRCLEIEEEIRLTDVEAKEIISKACGIKSTLELKEFDKDIINASLKLLKSKCISTRQLERLTGISSAIILKA